MPAPPIIHGSATSLGEAGAGQPIKMHKSREEFTSRVLEHLLGAVININLFMVSCSKIGDRWKEVTMIVQARGFFQNREPETLKNKVSSLLAWVKDGGKKKKAQSPLGKELDSDLSSFAALSGKLDAIQHLKIQAKDMHEDQKAHAKEVAQLIEKKDAHEDCKEQKIEEFYASLLERHDRAINIQERTSTALLEILRQGLLNN
ncbi:hypothetical protein JB92DRAFT_3104256 [Gautieria morchelliformis]|nr:hypothetical protein JB92DRAFT_3104256 [Gautieria morchelliformis]